MAVFHRCIYSHFKWNYSGRRGLLQGNSYSNRRDAPYIMMMMMMMMMMMIIIIIIIIIEKLIVIYGRH